MRDSKELKDSNRLKSILGCFDDSFSLHSLLKPYYAVTDFFTRLRERIGRSLAYAKFGYMHYDFDSAYLYSIMAFKLRRIRICLVNGLAVQEETDMETLDEAIDICDRLFGEDYEEKYDVIHSAKWGELEFLFEPTFHSVRKNINTEEEKAQEWKERLDIYNRAEQDRLVDIDRFAEILKTRAKAWWW